MPPPHDLFRKLPVSFPRPTLSPFTKSISEMSLRTQILHGAIPHLPTHSFTRPALILALSQLRPAVSDPEAVIDTIFGPGGITPVRALVESWEEEGKVVMKGEGEGKGKKGLERVLGRRLQWSAGVGEHLVEVGRFFIGFYCESLGALNIHIPTGLRQPDYTTNNPFNPSPTHRPPNNPLIPPVFTTSLRSPSLSSAPHLQTSLPPIPHLLAPHHPGQPHRTACVCLAYRRRGVVPYRRPIGDYKSQAE